MKKILAGMLALVLVFGTACSSGSGSKNFTLGESFTLGDWAIVVNSYETSTIIESGLGYFEADPGHVFVVFPVSATNNGSEEATFISFVTQSDKYVFPTLACGKEVYAPLNMIGYNEGISMGKVEPGENNSGMLVFEVTEAEAAGPLVLTMTLGKSSTACELA